MTVLEATDVRKSFGDVAVLDGVSLSADRGEFVGLIGPNGAGKTTLLRCLNGVLDPDAGTVTVDDDPIHGLSAGAVGRRVATVPQDTSLSFDFEVRDVVAMGRHPYLGRFETAGAEDRERVEAAMERTEVAQFADRGVGAVSGGERQRVVLARALAQDTPALLLDEPTASLDINHQVRTLELVADLVADGKAVVAAIHDLNLAAHYCDELALLSGGEVLAGGDPADVLTESHLESAFGTRAAVTSHPVTGATYVTALPERDGDAAGRVHVVAGGGTASRLLYLLDAAGYEVTVGALARGDADLETARQLGLSTVEMPPYAGVDDAAEREVREQVARADATVVADLEVGAGNLANLRAAAEAESLVLVEDRPFTRRNYTGDDGRAVYEQLRERARVVEPDDVLGAVAERIDRVRPAAADGGDERN